jgi:hypothetical protein
MQNHKKFYFSLLVISTVTAWHCATVQAPDGWLTDPQKAGSDVYGGWITIMFGSGDKKNAPVQGELLAISRDSLLIANEKFCAVAVSTVKSAKLYAYQSKADQMAGLVVLGMLSTASNGLWFILTAPMWMIFGSIATSIQSYEPILSYPDVQLDRFIVYTRYPQGLPSDIDRNKIKMK